MPIATFETGNNIVENMLCLVMVVGKTFSHAMWSSISYNSRYLVIAKC